MDSPHQLADPIPIELKPGQPAPPGRSHPAADTPDICAELGRLDIAVVMKATYEWGGYRYSNASDAIAAAKRAAK